MSAPTIAAPSTLLPDALADARAQLAAAHGVDIDDHLNLVASHASLKAALRRVLWVLQAEAVS